MPAVRFRTSSMMVKPSRRFPNGSSVITAMDSLKSAVAPKFRGAREFTRVASCFSSTRYITFSVSLSKVLSVLAKVVPGGEVAVTKKLPRSSRGMNSSGMLTSSQPQSAVKPATMGNEEAGKCSASSRTRR